jgi:hypothetical protein
MESVGNYKHKIILFGLFFTLTPLVIALCLVSLFVFNESKHAKSEVLASTSEANPSGLSIYAALPELSPQISEEIVSQDARSEIIYQYLTSYGSPLAEYSQKIVEIADKYDVDFRLIVAIAQQESNLCKFIPERTYNCWGWGIHSRGTLGFNSFEEGIETVTAGIKENYIDKGLKTPEEIMSKYTPSSPGTWAFGVSTFMSDME